MMQGRPAVGVNDVHISFLVNDLIESVFPFLLACVREDSFVNWGLTHDRLS